jgi:hypothetical protein
MLFLLQTYQDSRVINALHSLTLGTAGPSLLKLLPSTLRLFAHLQIAHNHVVVAVFGQLALAHISAHGDINENPVVLHPSCTWRNIALHDGSAIDIPDHAASPVWYAVFFDPGETKRMRLARHVVERCLGHAVLIPVLPIVVTPMQARVIDAVAIPALEDVDFAVVGPLEGVLWQQPIRGPDALGHGGQDGGRDIAARTREGLVRCEARRRIAAALHQTAHNQATVMVERIGRVVRVHLLLVVSPPMIARLVSEVLRYGRCSVKRRLPVHALPLWRWEVLRRRRLR